MEADVRVAKQHGDQEVFTMGAEELQGFAVDLGDIRKVLVVHHPETVGDGGQFHVLGGDAGVELGVAFEKNHHRGVPEQVVVIRVLAAHVAETADGAEHVARHVNLALELALQHVPDDFLEIQQPFLNDVEMVILAVRGAGRTTAGIDDVLDFRRLDRTRLEIADAAAELDGPEQFFRIEVEPFRAVLFHVRHVVGGNGNSPHRADGDAVAAFDAPLAVNRLAVLKHQACRDAVGDAFAAADAARRIDIDHRSFSKIKRPRVKSGACCYCTLPWGERNPQ
ncbi:MAG: hypothetical protein LUE17_12835 [Planctomycetaceae bacterium]|nr:hypothetical protein [Planctomycetaceae bacterium]